MFVVEAPNLNKWHVDFKRFARDIDGPAMKRAFDGIVRLFYSDERGLFRSQGASGKHGSWPALGEKYRLWKAKKYPGRGIMVLKTNLFQSLQGGKDAIKTYSRIGSKGWFLQIGTNVRSGGGHDYPKSHQTGKAVGKKTRRTIDPTNQQMKMYLLQIQKEFVKAGRPRKTIFERISSLGPRPKWDSGRPVE